MNIDFSTHTGKDIADQIQQNLLIEQYLLLYKHLSLSIYQEDGKFKCVWNLCKDDSITGEGITAYQALSSFVNKFYNERA